MNQKREVDTSTAQFEVCSADTAVGMVHDKSSEARLAAAKGSRIVFERVYGASVL